MFLQKIHLRTQFHALFFIFDSCPNFIRSFVNREFIKIRGHRNRRYTPGSYKTFTCRVEKRKKWRSNNLPLRYEACRLRSSRTLELHSFFFFTIFTPVDKLFLVPLFFSRSLFRPRLYSLPFLLFLGTFYTPNLVGEENERGNRERERERKKTRKR